MARHPGAHGAEFYRNRAAVLASSEICYFCKHPGARQVNHIIQRRHGGSNRISNLAPAHGHDDSRGRSGIDYRCPTCGDACNQSRRNDESPPSYRSRDW